jgi:hypothetical protein
VEVLQPLVGAAHAGAPATGQHQACDVAGKNVIQIQDFGPYLSLRHTSLFAKIPA